MGITAGDGWQLTSNFDGKANAHPCPTLATPLLGFKPVSGVVDLKSTALTTLCGASGFRVALVVLKLQM